MNNSKIPFLDLITPHQELEEELVEVFRTTLRNAGFIGGPMVEAFERDFAEFCGTKECIGVGSGTDALRFALISAGVEKGDIVITVPNTFIATTEAISQAGGIPDFVDVDESTYNMDPEKLREYLEIKCEIDKTGKPMHREKRRPVAAVIPVHLYGRPADMDSILEIAEQYGLLVIEDACQAHGAEYFSRRENKWKKTGSMGIAAAFSFYPGKNLGACGEAGAVTTNDETIAKKIRMIRDHGQAQKYHHDIEGYNGRLDAIQAGVLSIKLKHLAEWNESRRQKALVYDDLLGGIEKISLPVEPGWAKSVYHLYVIRSACRDLLQESLRIEGIMTGLHYPVPLHLQKSYAGLGIKSGSFSVSERAASEILSLPMWPGLSREQQVKIVAVISDFFIAGSMRDWFGPSLKVRQVGL